MVEEHADANPGALGRHGTQQQRPFSFAPSGAQGFAGTGLPRARARGYSQTPRWGWGSFRDRLPGAYAARLSSTAPLGLGLAEAGVGPEAESRSVDRSGAVARDRLSVARSHSAVARRQRLPRQLGLSSRNGRLSLRSAV